VRDAYASIEASGAVVIGISPDPLPALVKFRKDHDLPFVLLSDPDHKVAEAYGAWGEKKRGDRVSMGILRSHFGVDEEGKLAELELKVQPLATADMALRLIEL
jgi:peroxiredoxin Q/BCP